jgi:hypothetical protein
MDSVTPALHRANYLRRAIPRLREQYKASGGVITWVEDVAGFQLTPWQRLVITAPSMAEAGENMRRAAREAFSDR